MRYLVKKCVASLLCVTLLLSCMAIGSVSVFAEDGSGSSGTPHVVFYVNDQTSNNVFKDINPDVSGKISSFADTPDRNGYIFKGWYYDRSSDSRPVDFENDIFTEDTSVYARWIEVGETVRDSEDESNGNTVGDFDLLGVQTRDEMYDKNYNIIKPAGLRFIASLRNDLLQKLDSISDKKVVSDDGHLNDVEYGILLTKEKNVQNWLNYASSHVDLSNYKLKYNGTDVNGIDTTVEKTKDYQGFVLNVDCTSDDYSDRQIKDHRSFDKYRLYTAVVTYSDENDSAKAEPITGRAYIRYYDANGRLRTVHDDYDGTDTHGGASVSYNDVPDGEESEPMVYYSNVPLMISDANNLTTENADVPESRFEEDAVGAMYIDGDTAMMRLVKDDHIPDSAGIQRLNVKSDFDLDGHTLSFDRTRLYYLNDFSIHDGSYVMGPSALAGLYAQQGNMSVYNMDFSVDDMSTSRSLPQFAAIFCCPQDDSNTVSINNVSVNINNADVTGMHAWGVVASGDADVNNLTVNADIDTSDTTCNFTGLSVEGSKAVVRDCDIDVSMQSADCIWGVQGLVSTSCALYDCDVNVVCSDTVNRGFLYNTTSNISMNAYNCNFSMTAETVDRFNPITAGYSTDEETPTTATSYGVLDNCTVNVDINKLNNSGFVQGFQFFSDVDFDLINCQANVDIGTYGSSSLGSCVSAGETSHVYVSGGRYYTTVGLVDSTWMGVGLNTSGSAVMDVDEQNGQLYVHGGNGGINTHDSSVVNIYGGDFCSPTHGVADISVLLLTFMAVSFIIHMMQERNPQVLRKNIRY